MKNEKLIKAFFTSGSSSTTESIIALVGGLAAGAVIGILFAPGSGKAIRSNIADSFKELVGIAKDEPVVLEVPQKKAVTKKPKSDIKTLIHEAHEAGVYTGHAVN